MTRAIDLIIPDAGPLISLAHANRLDLIVVFARPVKILDVVRLECLKKPASADHAILRQWFDTPSNLIQVIETPICAVYDEALRREQAGERRATRGLGDAAIAWALQNVDRFADPGSIPLVLLEDRTLAATALASNAHVLSTRAWLAGLERAGLIDSADAVIAAIGDQGRDLSELQVDRPAREGDHETDWIANL